MLNIFYCTISNGKCHIRHCRRFTNHLERVIAFLSLANRAHFYAIAHLVRFIATAVAAAVVLFLQLNRFFRLLRASIFFILAHANPFHVILTISQVCETNMLAAMLFHAQMYMYITGIIEHITYGGYLFMDGAFVYDIRTCSISLSLSGVFCFALLCLRFCNCLFAHMGAR